MHCVIAFGALCFGFNIRLISAGIIKQEFIQWNLPCQLNVSIIQTLNAQSLLHCALMCENYSRTTFSKFIWVHESKSCMVLSSNRLAGTSPKSVTTQSEWNFFSKRNKDCWKAGYVYELETNTCLQYRVTAPVTWYEARSICTNDGGDLISLTSKRKVDFVVNYLHCKRDMWIGLKGLQWVSGSNYTDYGYTYLFNNYDALYTSDSEADCCTFLPINRLKFQDDSCNMNTRQNIICELSLP